MASAYDNWLTHDPRDDGYEEFCQNCESMGVDDKCRNLASPNADKHVDDEDWCDEWGQADMEDCDIAYEERVEAGP